MKIGSLYERNDIWFFQPSSKTINGLWVASPPLVSLDRNESQQRKCEVVFETLNASTDGIPVPKAPGALVAPLLELANVKSWASFMTNTKCISLVLDHNQLTLLPQKRLKRPAGALESMPEEAIVLSEDVSPFDLESAIEEALRRSV